MLLTLNSLRIKAKVFQWLKSPPTLFCLHPAHYLLLFSL